MFPALKNILFITILLFSFSCGQYAGNNDYAGGGIGGTGITGVSVGKITAVDLAKSTIDVNGVAFTLNGTGITVNGTTADISNLKVGMIVKVNGEFDPVNDAKGKALSIDFEDNLEGPVDTGSIDTIANSFKVLGKIIFVDTTAGTGTKFEGIASFEKMIEGNVVEVSGFEAVDGSIHATYIELKEETFQQGLTLVEFKGAITNIDTVSNTFELNNITISYDDTKVNENVLTKGLNIEVKGTISPDNAGILDANKIELHDTAPIVKEGEKVEIEGYISEVTPLTETTVDFKVNNQSVHIDTTYTTIKDGTISTIQPGVRIEVKGTIVSGILNAVKVSIETEEHRENDKKNVNVEVKNTSNESGTSEDTNTNSDSSTDDTSSIANNITNTNDSSINNNDTNNDDKVNIKTDDTDSHIDDSTINNSTNDSNNTAGQDNTGNSREDGNVDSINNTDINNNDKTNTDKIDGEQTIISDDEEEQDQQHDNNNDAGDESEKKGGRINENG